MRKIALDLGFGGIKLSEVVGEGIASHVIPSTFGLGEIKETNSLSFGLRRQRRTEGPAEITFEGLSYVVGQDAHKYVKSPDRLSLHKFGEAEALQPLVYTALATRLNGGPYQTGLLVGLPVEVLQEKETVMKQLRTWLVGEHQFSMNGSPYQITIDKVVPVAQPLGAYCNFNLSYEGRWLKSARDRKVPTIVVDIGFNTIDMFGVENKQLMNRYTAGDTLGMHRVNQAVVDAVRDKYGVRMNLHEADAYVRQFLAGKAVEYPHPQGVAVIDNLIKSALSDAWSQVSQFIRKTLDNAQYRWLIFTGGGTEAFRSYILPEYPSAILFPNSVTANSEGLAKLAVKAKVL